MGVTGLNGDFEGCIILPRDTCAFVRAGARGSSRFGNIELLFHGFRHSMYKTLWLEGEQFSWGAG